MKLSLNIVYSDFIQIQYYTFGFHILKLMLKLVLIPLIFISLFLSFRFCCISYFRQTTSPYYHPGAQFMLFIALNAHKIKAIFFAPRAHAQHVALCCVVLS